MVVFTPPRLQGEVMWTSWTQPYHVEASSSFQSPQIIEVFSNLYLQDQNPFAGKLKQKESSDNAYFQRIDQNLEFS